MRSSELVPLMFRSPVLPPLSPLALTLTRAVLPVVSTLTLPPALIVSVAVLFAPSAMLSLASAPVMFHCEPAPPTVAVTIAC